MGKEFLVPNGQLSSNLLSPHDSDKQVSSVPQQRNKSSASNSLNLLNILISRQIFLTEEETLKKGSFNVLNRKQTLNGKIVDSLGRVQSTQSRGSLVNVNASFGDRASMKRVQALNYSNLEC